MPDFSQLTERQRRDLRLYPQKDRKPRLRADGARNWRGFGIKSPNGVMCHLKALEKKGLITREEHSARAIQLVDHKLGLERAALLGTVAAGFADPSRGQRGASRFSGLVRRRRSLRAQSHRQLHDRKPHRGRRLCRHSQAGRRRERRTGRGHDRQRSHLEKYYHEKGHIRLEPANGDMKPIIVDPTQDAQILASWSASCEVRLRGQSGASVHIIKA